MTEDYENKKRMKILAKHLGDAYYKTGELHNKIDDAILEIIEAQQQVGVQPEVIMNFAETLIEKFDAEVAIEKDYIDGLEEQQYSKGIWDGIRLSRVMLKEIIRLSKISE